MAQSLSASTISCDIIQEGKRKTKESISDLAVFMSKRSLVVATNVYISDHPKLQKVEVGM
jgi:hypothetical protein